MSRCSGLASPAADRQGVGRTSNVTLLLPIPRPAVKVRKGHDHERSRAQSIDHLVRKAAHQQPPCHGVIAHRRARLLVRLQEREGHQNRLEEVLTEPRAQRLVPRDCGGKLLRGRLAASEGALDRRRAPSRSCASSRPRAPASPCLPPSRQGGDETPLPRQLPHRGPAVRPSSPVAPSRSRPVPSGRAAGSPRAPHREPCSCQNPTSNPAAQPAVAADWLPAARLRAVTSPRAA
jgi:hypothetical protein